MPPSLKPREHEDNSDTYYLNQPYDPIINLLKKLLSVKVYNGKWLGAPPKTISLPFKHDHAMLFYPSAVHIPFPNLSKLHEETNTLPPETLIKSVDIDDYSPPTSVVSHQSFLTSNGLFFIRYTPKGTIKFR